MSSHQPPDAANAVDPRLARVLAITSRLTQILVEEASVLQDGPARKIARFHAEKSKLMVQYQSELSALKTLLSSPQAPHQRDIQVIKAATQILNQALRNHDYILAAKKTATEGILQAIGKEVARRNKPVESYQKDGALGPAMPVYAAARPTTLTLDQRV